MQELPTSARLAVGDAGFAHPRPQDRRDADGTPRAPSPVMTAIERIMIGYDGFERGEALPAEALWLARAHRATLHVVHVVPSLPRSIWWSEAISARELQRAVIEQRGRQLHELAHARTRGVKVTTEVREGIPHVELIRAAVAQQADVLVVSDEPLRRGKRGAFGTVTMKLLRKCPVPVWAARTATHDRVRRVMAAVDVEDTHSLNEQVLRLAQQFARARDARLFVIHAWTLWGEHLLKGYGGVSPASLEKLLADRHLETLTAVQQLVAAQVPAERQPEVLVVKGDAREAIPAAVREHQIDLLVMGTVARAGVSGFVIGNTAEKILNDLDCSVLTAKPEGFVTPIALAEPPRGEDDEDEEERRPLPPATSPPH
jgi:universal stress protein E